MFPSANLAGIAAIKNLVVLIKYKITKNASGSGLLRISYDINTSLVIYKPYTKYIQKHMLTYLYTNIHALTSFLLSHFKCMTFLVAAQALATILVLRIFFLEPLLLYFDIETFEQKFNLFFESLIFMIRKVYCG